MYPLTHIVLSLVLAIILKLLTALSSVEILIILMAAILIDIDHWFVYVIKKKSFSISGSYKWFISLTKLKRKPVFLCIFHTIECFIVLILLSKILFFKFVLIGFVFHNLLDIIEAIAVWRYDREISLLYAIFKAVKT